MEDKVKVKRSLLVALIRTAHAVCRKQNEERVAALLDLLRQMDFDAFGRDSICKGPVPAFCEECGTVVTVTNGLIDDHLDGLDWPCRGVGDFAKPNVAQQTRELASVVWLRWLASLIPLLRPEQQLLQALARCTSVHCVQFTNASRHDLLHDVIDNPAVLDRLPPRVRVLFE